MESASEKKTGIEIEGIEIKVGRLSSCAFK